MLAYVTVTLFLCVRVLCNIVQWMTEIVFLLRVTVYSNLCLVFTFNSAVDNVCAQCMCVTVRVKM